MPTIAHQLERAIKEGNKQAECIAALEDEIAAWKAEKEDQRIYVNQQRERAEKAEAENSRLKPIVEDLAAMLPRMPVVLFHYNPAVKWKALAVRAVEELDAKKGDKRSRGKRRSDTARRRTQHDRRNIPTTRRAL